MKPNYLSFLIILIFINSGFTQVVPPSTEDNAVVYFLRGTMKGSFNPSLINVTPHPYFPTFQNRIVLTNLMDFWLYDGNKIIGQLYTKSYVRYECKAGNHLFQSMGKTNDFVEAELIERKVYFIDVSAKIGERSPDLRPIYPDNELWIDGILAFIASQSADSISDKKLQKLQKHQHKKIERMLIRYEEDRYKGRLPAKLTWDMYYRPFY